jgi:hypothetical protein
MRYSMFSGGEKNLLYLFFVLWTALYIILAYRFPVLHNLIRSLHRAVRGPKRNSIFGGSVQKNLRIRTIPANLIANYDDYIGG